MNQMDSELKLAAERWQRHHAHSLGTYANAVAMNADARLLASAYVDSLRQIIPPDQPTAEVPLEPPFNWKTAEANKLRKQLQAKESEVAREKARTDQAKADAAYQHKQRIEAEKSLVATKGVVTKLKKRGAAGVCPCCNRTVKQMAEHLAEKHPEYVQEQGITPKPRIRPLAK
jgi:hypothetical protein